MIRDALEFLHAKFQKAEKPFLVGSSTTEDILFNDGMLTHVPKAVPLRAHVAHSLETIAVMSSDDSLIWHGGNVVTLVIDNSETSHRENTVVWNLLPSVKFEAVSQGTKEMDHKAFVQYVVRNLRDEFEADNPGVLGSIRSLKFAVNDVQDNDIQHGKESMGRSINRQVTGASDLPETVVLNVRRWADLEIFVAVELMLIIDAENKTLQLKPLADSAKRAEMVAHDTLGDIIKNSTDCIVLHGRV